MATMDDFNQLEMRVGTVVDAEAFPEARKPAIKLYLDFGMFGRKQSSAQITKHYHVDDLIFRQVVAVLNLPNRRIAGFESEVLVIGGVSAADDVLLLKPDSPVPNGTPVS